MYWETIALQIVCPSRTNRESDFFQPLKHAKTIRNCNNVTSETAFTYPKIAVFVFIPVLNNVCTQLKQKLIMSMFILAPKLPATQ